ncbi:MAG TPA: helix-hairpin-helix domain-containing protein [Conexibacter sp.]|nr:helix-hairpin-helix domain-containing protein [Conexibacter sp.]
MPSPPSKPQLAIYAALALAVVLIGARFLRSPGGGGGAGEVPADVSTAFAEASTTSTGAPDGTLDAGGAAVGARLVVDVKGAVRRPGVYRLAAGARAYDAVRRAGGMTARADRIGVNLAARVVDGGEVVVPARGAGPRVSSAAGAEDAGGGDAAADGGAPLSLDLNTATEQELEQLDGVGPSTAARIVAYREQHGGIATVDDLDDVSGIGPAKLAAIRAQLGR